MTGRRVPFGTSATAVSSEPATTAGAVSLSSASSSLSTSTSGATGVRFYRSSSAAASSSSGGVLMSRVDTGGDGIFDSIFRPPYDIMFNMDFFYVCLSEII